jgi:transposase-like protein
MSVLSKPYFHDETAAYAFLEGLLWPNGPTCPHCGNANADKIGVLKGKTTRPGLKKCYACRSQFTVKVGTVYEASHIPLHKWLQATFLLTSSKKGFSSHQLHRLLGVTYKSAWFMTHRIREAMRAGKMPPLGGEGKAVEADETYIGRKDGTPVKAGVGHKRAVVSLVERGGSVRSFHVDRTSVAEVGKIVVANIDRESALMTDESKLYWQVGKRFSRHEVVKHRDGEYGRGDATTNTIEGFFSIFKRGMKGVYQHCGEKHLHRYLAEFDFRYNNRIALGTDDVVRTDQALKGIVGKRLTYKSTNGSPA